MGELSWAESRAMSSIRPMAKVAPLPVTTASAGRNDREPSATASTTAMRMRARVMG